MTGFDIFAQTSDVQFAESLGSHDVEILFADGQKAGWKLDNLPNKNTAKLFKFDLTALECVTIFDVTEIKLIAESTDGWNIETIVTTLADNKGRTYSGSIDRNVNRWVDHGEKPEFESYVLNLSSHG